MYKFFSYLMALVLVFLGAACILLPIIHGHGLLHCLVALILGVHVMLLGIIFPRAVRRD